MTTYPEESIKRRGFVLITAARNEAIYIDNTLRSVIAQTILPTKWIIISDGSTDRTDEIVLAYAERYDFIKLLRREDSRGNGVGFASKVYALRKGYEQLKEDEYEFIGILDADISFGPDYYERVLEYFMRYDKLGIAGGYLQELVAGIFKQHPSNMIASVAGGIQLFRRQCYEDIGGLIPVSPGGEDWIAEVMARSKGWKVRSFDELKVFHHKSGSSVRGGVVREALRLGTMDYLLGSHPLFELVKCLRRVRERPYLINAALRFVGYLSSHLQRKERPVPREFIEYLRNEQLKRLMDAFFKRRHSVDVD